MVFVWLILILVIVLVIFAIAFLIKQLKQSLNSPANAEMAQNTEGFACFSYTDEEWEYVNRLEFVEDERGKSFFDRYSGVISYNKVAGENTHREICFTPQIIYLTDGKKGKSFTVNKLNSFGNGFRLSSVDLLHLSPLKKLRIKISGIGISPESNELDFDLEYLVPIPQSAVEKIDEILKTYGDIILSD